MTVAGPVLVLTGKGMLNAEVSVPSAAPVAVIVFASAPGLADDERDSTLVRELHARGVAMLSVSLMGGSASAVEAELLAGRFIEIAEWLKRDRLMGALPRIYMASREGAAGALVAAAQRPDLVAAVVSVDGRTDLAFDSLPACRVPTLLVVRDMHVLLMNREALASIRGERRIEVVHETGCDTMVQKIVQWLEDKIGARPVASAPGVQGM